MKNTIRCCISCILPCGALDVIRIVHSNGKVEELSGTIKAGDIMKAHPKHLLKKPSSPPPSAGDGGDSVVPKIVIVPPDAELQRGKIYSLMPAPPPPKSEKSHLRLSPGRRKKKEQSEREIISNNINSFRRNNGNAISMADLLVSSDQYLTDILSEKISTQKDRRRGRVTVWRPHLESISESPSDI